MNAAGGKNGGHRARLGEQAACRQIGNARAGRNWKMKGEILASKRRQSGASASAKG